MQISVLLNPDIIGSDYLRPLISHFGIIDGHRSRVSRYSILCLYSLYCFLSTLFSLSLPVST